MSLLSVKEAALLVNVSIPTIYRALVAKKIVKIGNKIDKTELLRAFNLLSKDDIIDIKVDSVDDKNNSELSSKLSLLEHQIELLNKQVEELRLDKHDALVREQRLFDLVETKLAALPTAAAIAAVEETWSQKLKKLF